MIAGIFWQGSLLSIKLNDILFNMGFQKGHIGYNKGKKLHGEWRNCLRCTKKCWFNMARILNGGGKYCSQNCSNKSTSRPGEPLKEKVGYFGVHSWLYHNFGSPEKCEKCSSLGYKNKGNKWSIQWAKIKGKEYIRVRENFMALCARCHIFYDDTLPDSTGRFMSKQTRKKISESLKNYFANR